MREKKLLGNKMDKKIRKTIKHFSIAKSFVRVKIIIKISKEETKYF